MQKELEEEHRRRSSEAVNPKVAEALDDFADLVEQRLTGTFVIEFNQGVPVLRKRTETRRYGTKSP